jgi:hypothetical protein
VITTINNNHSSVLANNQTERRTTPRNRRIVSRGHVADVLFDKRSMPYVFHYIVQRIGSAEIQHWGTTSSFEEAVEEASAYLAMVPYP